jgi:hypothetical protein
MHLRTKHPDGRQKFYPVRLTLEAVVDAPVEVGYVEAEFVDDDGGVLPVDEKFFGGNIRLTLNDAPLLHVTLTNATRKP